MGRAKLKRFGSPMAPEKKLHLAQLKRAAWLRKRIDKDGGTAEHRAELAGLPQPRGRYRKRALDEGGQNAYQENAPEAPAGEDGTGPTAIPPPPPPRPDPEAPPRVVVADEQENWRAKYRQAVGRRGTCEGIAKLYSGALKKLVAFIESAGSRPLISAEMVDGEIFPCAVLTVDRLLPADFEVTPEIELAVGSGVLLGQGAIVAAKIKKDEARRGGRPAPVVSVVNGGTTGTVRVVSVPGPSGNGASREPAAQPGDNEGTVNWPKNVPAP